MIRSASKDNKNYADPHAGESLFQYLKRKKKCTLNLMLNASSTKLDQSALMTTRSHHKKTAIQRQQTRGEDDAVFPSSRTSRKNIRCNGMNIVQNDFSYPDAITPRKMVSFAQEFNQSRRRQDQSFNKERVNRSFIDIISPIKNSSIIRQQQNTVGRKSALIDRDFSRGIENQNNSLSIGRKAKNSQSKKSLKTNDKQDFARKMLNKNISGIETTLHNLMGTGKILKDKAHCLFIEMKPILEYIEDNSGETIKRKTFDLKDRLRVFEHHFKNFQVPNCHEIIDRFNISLREHLDSLEAENKVEFEKKMMDSVARIKFEKNAQIDQLTENLNYQRKNVELSNRRIEKLETKLEKNSQQTQIRQISFNESLQKRIDKYEIQLAENSDKISSLEIHLSQETEKTKSLQKELRSVQYSKEDAETRFQNQKQAIISSKEEYLLNQIMMLKQQFKRDLHAMSQCQAIKSEDCMRQMTMYKSQIQHKKSQIIAIIALSQDRDKSNSEIQVKNQSTKRQNQCLVTDLHRMNQQLFQHWLALKDIKILSQRMHCYDQFSRIFEDLAFNDRLFQ